MLAALLVSCASPYTQVDESIVAEMDSAARQAASSQPAAVREALLPPLRAEIPKVPGASAEPRFDLVVNAAPAQQVFMSVVSGTRYSMVVNPEVSGRLSLNLKDVTVREALEAIREVYGYEFRVDGTRIYVEAAGMRTRVFHVSYLSSLRTGRSDVRVSSGSTSAIVAGQPTAGGGAAAPVVGGPQAGQSVNTIGLGQLNQTTNDATRVSTFSQSDFWQELTTALRTLVGTGAGRSIVVSPQSGVVVIRAMPQEIRSVESYLKAIRVSVERQVMLEAKIIDVTLNDAYQAGVNWAGFSGTRFSGGVQGPGTTLGTTGALVSSSPLGLTANPSARTVVSTTAAAAASATAAGAAGLGVFGLALQTRNFAALLQFLESQGTTQVLSSPRVATLNNQKAVLKVGTDDFFITNVKSTPVVNAATGVPVGATLEPTLSSFFSGVSLDITPQIDEEGNINLHIHPLVSKVENGSLTFDFGTGIGITNIPTAKSTINETDTMVRVQDGNIVALGGLMQLELENSRSGIPGVQQIPGVGGLFGNRARNVVKKELVILIKPTVIKSEADWEQDITATGDRLRSMGSGAPARTPRAE